MGKKSSAFNGKYAIQARDLRVHNGDFMAIKGVDPVEVRRRIGMVVQKLNPFPKSIYENVAWGARINGFNWTPSPPCALRS